MILKNILIWRSLIPLTLFISSDDCHKVLFCESLVIMNVNLNVNFPLDKSLVNIMLFPNDTENPVKAPLIWYFARHNTDTSF